MARPHEANSDSEMESEQAEAPTIVKKRKEVTTASILENFLLLATSLDDTVREDAVVLAMGVPDSSSSKTSGKSSSKADSKTPVLQARLVNLLNIQRQEVRESIREAITTFALEYDTESARLGEENESEFDYDPDEQVNLPKDRWKIDNAIERLRELNDELKMECVDLGRDIRQQEKQLKRVVDDIVEQRK